MKKSIVALTILVLSLVMVLTGCGSGNSGGSFKICYSKTSKNSAFFYQNGNKTEAVIVKTDSGEILNRFQVGAIASKDFKIARATQAGYFISGAYSACEFLEDGTILYTAYNN